MHKPIYPKFEVRKMQPTQPDCTYYEIQLWDITNSSLIDCWKIEDRDDLLSLQEDLRNLFIKE
jgi:hypothetical protein